MWTNDNLRPNTVTSKDWMATNRVTFSAYLDVALTRVPFSDLTRSLSPKIETGHGFPTDDELRRAADEVFLVLDQNERSR
jgi:hypothetical protein